MIYVDEEIVRLPKWKAQERVGRKWGQHWSHLLADSTEELHAFAATLGLRPEWSIWLMRTKIEYYDLVPSKRRWAVKLGAKEIALEGFLKEKGIESL